VAAISTRRETDHQVSEGIMVKGCNHSSLLLLLLIMCIMHMFSLQTNKIF